MKILLTGRNGQVGWELERALAPLGEVVATDRSTLDLADPDAIRRVVREARPEIIVNAAAYTAVDEAESEPELAMRINGFAPGVLAEEAKRLGALLVHYSTDYVFDGEKATPYVEEDEPNPLNVYGRTKLKGERAVQSSGCRHLILRTSWVYGARGKNFLLAILRKARDAQELRVVVDQVGAPTSVELVARATLAAVTRVVRASEPTGTYHMTSRGETSWHGFAQAILSGVGVSARVTPIKSSDFSSTAVRPHYSVLDTSRFVHTFDFEPPSWTKDLSQVLQHVLPL